MPPRGQRFRPRAWPSPGCRPPRGGTAPAHPARTSSTSCSRPAPSASPASFSPLDGPRPSRARAAHGRCPLRPSARTPRLPCAPSGADPRPMGPAPRAHGPRMGVVRPVQSARTPAHFPRVSLTSPLHPVGPASCASPAWGGGGLDYPPEPPEGPFNRPRAGGESRSAEGRRPREVNPARGEGGCDLGSHQVVRRHPRTRRSGGSPLVPGGAPPPGAEGAAPAPTRLPAARPSPHHVPRGKAGSSARASAAGRRGARAAPHARDRPAAPASPRRASLQCSGTRRVASRAAPHAVVGGGRPPPLRRGARPARRGSGCFRS
ncbi:hypothetical protein BCF33_0282 [Hasllibacter halocynthiae]|uniref:Uncharacterized protein n=1 Tax=Hasllibacter halocynthiae TaxID=595589 RepID=A0A2T0X6W6_9RHOB|nr:hypothetical protein BCF33_0282 [Hasllibacter halocynthiae]